MSRAEMLLGTLVVVLLAVLTLGWALWPAPRPALPASTAVRQADGSLVAAQRAPTAAEVAKAPHAIPRGLREERRISATIRPKPVASAADADCPPTTVDLSLVRDGDMRRVIVSSPDGEVTTATDLVFAPSPPARPWAAGLSYDPVARTGGAWLERDVARLRVGIEVSQTEDRAGLNGRFRVGWVF
ncbi:hypothetical protein [Jeongeupia naejangsanensis]|uniref:Uncharacterized protein n=1 Tax=Jeongeupia naejangsanensis TaxID=613195 RepID=A0ABS2BHC9_9NEIS|nr:hypothetical protein [Jeongeupia naejangsanensis]MBM3115008.1 hypothetical protein [Jeongeupia naejangsanensis]